MRVIVYKIDLRLNPEDEYPVLVPAFIPYPEDNPEVIERVKAEAVDGAYTIENWDDPPDKQVVSPRNITTGEYVTIDSVPVHSAIIVSEEGFPVKHQCYRHNA